MFSDIHMLKRRRGWGTQCLHRSVERLTELLQKREAWGLMFFFDDAGLDEASQQAVLDTIINDVWHLADPSSPLSFDHIVLVWFESGTSLGEAVWATEEANISILQYALPSPLEDHSRLPPSDFLRIAEILEEKYPEVFTRGRPEHNEVSDVESDFEPEEATRHHQPSIV
eukprot:UN2505